LTAGAAALGIIGIGFGLWWADAVAALVISVDIVHDGFTQISTAITDLMNRTPRRVDEKDYDELVFKVQHLFDHLEWVAQAEVRLREEGQVYFGEAFVIPKENITPTDLPDKIDEAVKKAKALNWRIFDLT